MLLLINSTFEEYGEDFKELVTPSQKRVQEYQNANLREMVVLNKDYATEVLGVLAAYQTKVSAEFVGVRNMGALLEKTDFKKEVNLAALTKENKDYWRAILEMNPGNQLLPVTNIFAQVSQGEFDYALKYIQIIRMFSDPKTIPDRYLEELLARLNLFNQKLNSRIEKGFVFHDGEKYQKAIAIYEEVLKDYPHSAWAKYELYFSENALAVSNKSMESSDRSDWDKAKIGIYKSNPLYNMDVRASNGKEGYLLFRRMSMSELFKDKDKRLEDLYDYANIALEFGIYDFAAQLYWLSVTFNKEDNDALFRFLYSVEKLEVTNLKDNFKGDFKKNLRK